jgi:PadR family transcriptional regulator PadR
MVLAATLALLGRGIMPTHSFTTELTGESDISIHSLPASKNNPSHRYSSGVLCFPIVIEWRLGYGYEKTSHIIAQVIESTSENALEVEQGSLYPALHRLEDRGLVSSEWGVSENNRKAKFYRRTSKGRKELSAAAGRWQRMTRAIGLVLGESFE